MAAHSSTLRHSGRGDQHQIRRNTATPPHRHTHSHPSPPGHLHRPSPLQLDPPPAATPLQLHNSNHQLESSPPVSPAGLQLYYTHQLDSPASPSPAGPQLYHHHQLDSPPAVSPLQLQHHQLELDSPAPGTSVHSRYYKSCKQDKISDYEDIWAVSPTPAPAANKFKIRNRKKPLTFFGKVPDVSFTNTLLKFRNRNKAFGGTKRTTTAAAITSQDNTEADATTTETPASVLSVEAELAEEEPQQKVTIGTKFPTVRKANKAPANGNIRVEFKKQVDTQTGARGKFFIKPDGRKPRVKSNIRAKFAHRGQHFGQIPAAAEDTAPGAATSSEEETFDGASSQLDLTPFNKVTDTETDKAAAEGVNTEKREVNNAEAPNKVSAAPALPAVAAPAQFSHELPLFPLQPVILNPRQQRTERPPPPPLPAAILNHINHITDIRSLPPLPPLFRNKKKQVSKVKKQEAPPSEEKVNEAHKDIITPPATNPTSSLLEQLVEGETSAAPPSPAPALSSSAVAPASESPSSSVTNKLSAFRALQQQVEKKEAESSLTLV